MVKMKFSFRVDDSDEWHELPGEYEVEDPENFRETLSFKWVNAETAVLPAWWMEMKDANRD